MGANNKSFDGASVKADIKVFGPVNLTLFRLCPWGRSRPTKLSSRALPGPVSRAPNASAPNPLADCHNLFLRLSF